MMGSPCREQYCHVHVDVLKVLGIVEYEESPCGCKSSQVGDMKMDSISKSKQDSDMYTES